MNLQEEISRQLSQAIGSAFPEAAGLRPGEAGLRPGGAGADPQVAPAQSEKFGDYQANFAMSLSKRLGRKPRDIAQAVIEALEPGEMLQPPEVAGPGFVNLRLRPEFIERSVAALADDERLGVPRAARARTIIVDFSSPNTCKPMHVGHIRSTVIGEAIRRLLTFLGHRVIADNHLGDWGTQFGLLIAGFRRFGEQVPEGGDPLGRLVAIYQVASAAAQSDESLGEEARAELAKLQAGDPENRRQWQLYNKWSLEHFNRIYERLGVRFDETHGESFYNDLLPGVVAELKAKGLARLSEGAVCIFWDDEQFGPMLIQKSDGAFLYATTDLATLKYRRERWRPDEIVYVTDARQQLHFKQLFSAAERWGVVQGAKLRHVWFGTILGPDGTPLKTRSGDLVPLAELLDEAERRALAVVQGKNPELTAAEMRDIARVVGLGAVKYADLSQNRQSDVVFNWDKMLAMQGNTAPYLQYAYARIRSIFRKGAESPPAAAELSPQPGATDKTARPVLAEPAERALALKLLQLPEALAGAAEDYRLNIVCAYLYELSAAFTGFYEICPVLKSAAGVRAARLRLCDLTARTLQTGLDLLGIEVVERM